MFVFLCIGETQKNNMKSWNQFLLSVCSAQCCGKVDNLDGHVIIPQLFKYCLLGYNLTSTVLDFIIIQAMDVFPKDEK